MELINKGFFYHQRKFSIVWECSQIFTDERNRINRGFIEFKYKGCPILLWFFTPAFSIFQPIAGTTKSAKKGKGEEGEQRGGRQLHTEISIQCPIRLFGNLRLFVWRHFYWTERIIFASRKCFTKDLRSNSCTVAKASESIRRIGAIWRCQEIGSRNPPSMVGEPEQEYKKGRDTFWNKTNTLDPSTQWSLRLLKDPYASFSTLRYVEAVILDPKLPENCYHWAHLQ